MKFSLTFKTPDVFDDIDRDYDTASERKEVISFAEQFVEYGEYIYIDFDTTAGTATVRKLK